MKNHRWRGINFKISAKWNWDLSTIKFTSQVHPNGQVIWMNFIYAHLFFMGHMEEQGIFRFHSEYWTQYKGEKQ